MVVVVVVVVIVVVVVPVVSCEGGGGGSGYVYGAQITAAPLLVIVVVINVWRALVDTKEHDIAFSGDRNQAVQLAATADDFVSFSFLFFAPGVHKKTGRLILVLHFYLFIFASIFSLSAARQGREMRKHPPGQSRRSRQCAKLKKVSG